MTWILEVFFLELGKNEDLENVDCWIEVLEKNIVLTLLHIWHQV